MLLSEMKKENYVASLLGYVCTAKDSAVWRHPAELSRGTSVAMAAQCSLGRRKKQIREGV